MHQSPTTSFAEQSIPEREHYKNQTTSENIVETFLPIPPHEITDFVIETFIIPEARITNMVNSLTELNPTQAALYYFQHKNSITDCLNSPTTSSFFSLPKDQNVVLDTMNQEALQTGVSQENLDHAYEKAQDSFEMTKNNLEIIDRVHGQGYDEKNKQDMESSFRILGQSLLMYNKCLHSLNTTFFPEGVENFLENRIDVIMLEKKKCDDLDEYNELEKELRSDLVALQLATLPKPGL